MQAHRQQAVIERDGSVHLERLPFRPGERVEVIVLAADSRAQAEQALRGTLVRYEDPFAPVAADDWKADEP